MAGPSWQCGGLRAERRAARWLGLAGGLYGRAFTGAVAVLAALAAAYFTCGTDPGTQNRTRSWFAGALVETFATSLLVGVAGASGARRTARLVAFVNDIHTLNTINKIDRLPKESFGEWWVWSAVAAGAALQGLSAANVALFTQGDAAVVTGFACMHLPHVFKPVLVLHYVCLAAMLHSSLEAARVRLEEAVLELGTGEEYDNAAYGRAYAAVQIADRSYLAARSLVRRLSGQEGPLVLLLLVASATRTLHCIYLLLSAADAPGSTASTSVRGLFVGVIAAWTVFELLLVAMMMEAWSRVAGTMSSLPPLAGSLLQRAAPHGALGGRLGGLAGSLQLGAARFSPLDVCTFSRPSMFALLSFCLTAASVMRQFNLRDVV